MSDFRGVLVEDSRLKIKETIDFAVMSGASQSTYQPFNAISISNSNINFQINVPSENICIDRCILLDSDFTFTVDFDNVPAGKRAFNWGWSESYAPFPMQQTFTNISCTVNNCTTSVNCQDVLAMVLRLNDSRILSSYNSGAPALPDDSYGVYANGVGATNNTLAGFQSAGFDSDFVGRGALPLVSIVLHIVNGNILDTSVIAIGIGNDIPGTQTAVISETWTVTFLSHFTEAFQCLSPWSSHYDSDESGLIGINNINFNISVASPSGIINRFFRTGNDTVDLLGVNGDGLYPSYITNVSPGSLNNPLMFTNTRMLFNFLSFEPSQASKLKSSKCVIPYMDVPRYLSTASGNPTIQPRTTKTLQSQSVNLNSVNDRILVAVRIPMSQQNIAMSDSFLTIENVSISYNNTSGILASATPIQLFQLSKHNGSAQNFVEFGGEASAMVANGSSGTVNIPTIGSILILNPAMNFNLDPSLSSSSLGQFQLQMSIQVYNQFEFPINPEIILVMLNSGVYISRNGVSEIQTGLLTRDVVLSVKKEEPAGTITSGALRREVGGRMHNMGSVGSHPIVNHMRKHFKHHAPHHTSHVKESMAGGYTSGGKMSRHRM